jgi:hypothetical protein
MLKLWHKVALAGLALVAILFAASYLFAPSQNVCGPDEYSHIKDCAQYHLGPAVFIWIVGKADAHNGLITAITTIFLTGITYLLVQLGREQSNTSRAQLRAYLSVVIGGAVFQDANLRFEGAPNVKNNGQTPAYKVRTWISADIISANLAETYDFDKARPADLGESQASVGPGETRTLRGVVENRVPDADVAMIKEGVKAALWAWGEVHYDDAFGKPHMVRFSQRLFWDRVDHIHGLYGNRFVAYD